LDPRKLAYHLQGFLGRKSWYVAGLAKYCRCIAKDGATEGWKGRFFGIYKEIKWSWVTKTFEATVVDAWIYV
jgi:hypothetical protein